MKKPPLSTHDVTTLALLIALLEISKRLLDPIPNVELISLMFIIFTIYLGRKTLIAAVGFTVLECFVYGVSVWTLMYLYVWPMLVIAACLATDLISKRSGATGATEATEATGQANVAMDQADPATNHDTSVATGQDGNHDTKISKHGHNRYNRRSRIVYSIISAAFGFLFGALCSIPNIFLYGLPSAIGWWITGLPYDLIHGCSNFVIMMVLFEPLCRVMDRVIGHAGVTASGE